jgi:hypothetical protein
MGVRITHDCVTLYCSTSGWAFGPVFEDADQAEAFLKWSKKHVSRDLRMLSDEELEKEYHNWLRSDALCQECGDHFDKTDGVSELLCAGCLEYALEEEGVLH